MRCRATPRFWAAYGELPPEIRELARKGYRLFRENARHPSLHFKKVHDRDPIYSVRVTLGYRAVGLLEDEEITWFWIGTLSMTAFLSGCSSAHFGPTRRVSGGDTPSAHSLVRRSSKLKRPPALGQLLHLLTP